MRENDQVTHTHAHTEILGKVTAVRPLVTMSLIANGRKTAAACARLAAAARTKFAKKFPALALLK